MVENAFLGESFDEIGHTDPFRMEIKLRHFSFFGSYHICHVAYMSCLP